MPDSSCLANPKSISFLAPTWSNPTLTNLRAQKTMSLEWRYTSASATTAMFLQELRQEVVVAEIILRVLGGALPQNPRCVDGNALASSSQGKEGMMEAVRASAGQVG